MKIKEGFIRKNIGGNEVVVAVGKTSLEFNAMINLNSTASLLWSYLEKGTTEEELVAALVEKYEIDDTTAKRDVDAFLLKARSAGIIE